MNDSEASFSVIVPDYLYESDGFLFDSEVLSSSDIEEESGRSEVDSSSSSIDYTELITNIQSGVYDLVSSDVVTLSELSLLNDRVGRLEDSTNTCLCFLIVFTVFAVIKLCFALFNKYLGLGQA